MQPSFDKWTSLFLFASFLGVFLAGLLFFHSKGNRRANKVLALFILIFSYALCCFSFYWAGYKGLLHQFLNAALNGYLLLGPLLLLYWQLLEKKAPLRLWLHFMPFLLATLLTAPVIFHLRPLLRLPAVHFYMPPLMNYVLPVCNTLSLLVYSLVLIRKTRLVKEELNRYALPEEKIRHQWLRKIAGYFLFFSFNYVLFMALYYSGLLKIEYDYMISFASALLIYITGVAGFRQPEIFNTGPGKNGKYERSSLKKEKAAVIALELENLMREKQPYLEPDLKIQQLAEMAGLSTHHLSQVINEQFGSSYAEYINRLRIEEACRLLRQPNFHDEKIIGVAFDVGYNNKTTFNLAFKKYTGKTPSAFKRELRVQQSTAGE